MITKAELLSVECETHALYTNHKLAAHALNNAAVMLREQDAEIKRLNAVGINISNELVDASIKYTNVVIALRNIKSILVSKVFSAYNNETCIRIIDKELGN